MEEIHNVVVVGSGPAGYTAAIYAARAELKPVIVEGLQYGGALMQTTEVENYPGFVEGVQGPELMDSMRKQAARDGTEFVSSDATGVDLTSAVKEIRVDERTLRARTVVLAMGSAYRTLGVPGELRLSGRGVSWCATCDGFFFKDQDIAVVGGGDSAMEEATFLSRFARSVTVVHRRDTLRASRIMQERAERDPKISFHRNAQVEEVLGSERVEGLALRDSITGDRTTLTVGGVFVAIGHDPRTALVDGQVPIAESGCVAVDGQSTRTSIAGVFACGDLVDASYRQAITAAGSGCRAALDVERYLAAQS